MHIVLVFLVTPSTPFHVSRFDLKKVGRIIKTVVEVQMLRQDLRDQRLDGLDKTWALEGLEHLSLVQLELKKIDPRFASSFKDNNHCHHQLHHQKDF